jgi:two-component system cell cycle response regulator
MIHLASALIAAGDNADTRALHRLLLDSSYTATLVHSGAEACAVLGKTRPDVVILGPDLADMPALDLLERIKDAEETRDIAVFVLSERPLAERGDALLAAGADDAVAWPERPAVIVARVRPLVRVATMQAELAARVALARDAGVAVTAEATAEDDEAPRILIVGETPAQESAAEALPDAELTRAPDLFEAQRLMEESRFDACVMAAEADVEAYLDLCQQIRRNPRLFNLPVVFMASPELLPDRAQPLGMGASHVLPYDAAAAELRFALMALVRRQRLRWAIRQALAATMVPALMDDRVPEVYGQAFLGAYLSARIASSRQRERKFSLIGFGFAGVDAIRHEFGEDAENSLLNQIGQWLTLLVRAEDLVARGDGARFCVTLPDTPLSEAQVVMHRIAGVISNTDFAVRDVYRVVNVWPLVNATALEAEDTADGLLGRVAVDYESEMGSL